MQSLDTLKELLGIVKAPFGNNATKSSEFGSAANADAVNYADGFPVKFATDPASTGLYLLRGDFNRIGEIVLREQYFRQCGGIHTFDSNVASSIGGYPQGAVLQFVANDGKLRSVISLVQNNSFNFIQNGVDHVNWEYCDFNPTSQSVTKYKPDYGDYTISSLSNPFVASEDCYAVVCMNGRMNNFSLVLTRDSIDTEIPITKNADQWYGMNNVVLFMKTGDTLTASGSITHDTSIAINPMFVVAYGIVME